MNDLKDRSNINIENLTQILQAKKNLPRINFKKLKLGRFQDLYNSFQKKTITTIILDAGLINQYFPQRTTKSTITPDLQAINPLRKRGEEKEELIVPKELQKPTPEASDEPVVPEIKEEIAEDIAEEIAEEIKEEDVTFNLEAQIAQEEESVIFSPSQVSLPPFKDDILSSSGIQPSFVWPPQNIEKKSKKKKSKKLKKKKKGKPYFIQTVQEQTHVYPWQQSNELYEDFENIFQGSLESTLLDIKTKEQTPKPDDIPLVLKAVLPQTTTNDESLEIIFENIKFKPHSKAKDLFFKVELLGKGFVKKMLNRFGSIQVTPIRIIIYGGLIVTLGYLVWSYNSGNLNINYFQKPKQKQLVRDLFKDKHLSKKNTGLEKEKVDLIKPFSRDDGGIFKPIGEAERLALIKRAQEALESRIDPFGQEDIIPKKTIEEKAKEKEDEAPKEIELQRKQIELVGIISSKKSDLALINVYVADYVVNPDDPGEIIETKLKTALSMAVPNRLEISVLDPVEGWNVKKIQKSLSKTEDPIIELVKGNQKFKLKVGQRVLLPEEE